MKTYLIDFDIEDADGWYFYYEENTTNFRVEAVDEVEYVPVFMFDKDGYPDDFIGWNRAE